MTNDGTLSTPDGQTILAAGLQVGLDAHAGSDATLRGLDVYVGAVSNATYGGSAGVVSNGPQGLIDSPRSDVILVGSSVVQDGVINNSTSVVRNGRIDLLADYNAVVTAPSSNSTALLYYPTASGTILLGGSSVTQVLPETASSATVVGSQLALPSIVDLQGQTINLAAGALLDAPGANLLSSTSVLSYSVNLTTGITLDAGSWFANNGIYSFAHTDGDISVGAGAEIDAAGSVDVAASVNEDIVSAQLLGTQLADDPALRNGVLRGQTVSFNILQSGTEADGTSWVGTPLFDTSGYVSLIPHTVGELTAGGGTVALNAGGSIQLQPGAVIDVSGGSINYTGANVQTTQLLSGGHIYGIAQATSDLTYSGLYQGFTTSYAKYGLTQTFGNVLGEAGDYFLPGYIQGGNGGGLSITAPVMALQGTLLGSTMAGANQLSNLPATAAKYSLLGQGPNSLPLVSNLSLNFSGQYLSANTALNYSPDPADVVFQGTSGMASNPFAGSGNQEVDLSSSLLGASNFGDLSIVDNDNYFGTDGNPTGSGNIVLPQGVTLNLPPGGILNLSAGNIDIDGTISAPGGQVNLEADNASPLLKVNATSTPLPDAARGKLILGADGVINVAGLVADNRTSGSSPSLVPTVIGGGSINLEAYDLTLSSGSLVDASGGVAVSPANAISYGAGGSISVAGGEDPNFASIIGGRLEVAGATLQAYSGAGGGSLKLQAPQVQIGGQALLNGGTAAGTLWINPQAANGALLGDDFFSQGGFAHFTLNGLGLVGGADGYLPAVLVAPGAVVAPVNQSELVTLSPTDLSVGLITLEPYQRGADSITLNALGVTDTTPDAGSPLVVRGDLVMDEGSSIALNPNSGSQVVLHGDTVQVGGNISVPGGVITVSGKGSSASIFLGSTEAIPTAILESGSFLSTAGTSVLSENPFGVRTGSVLAGGTVNVSGNIVAASGATIDVSGATDVFDLAPGFSGASLTSNPSQATLIPTRVNSNGGAINLAGGQELYTAATLRGYAGGTGPAGGVSSALGGSLSVSSGIYPLANDASQTPLDSTLLVTQAIPSLGAVIFGQGLTDSQGNPLAGQGYFGADSFSLGNGATVGGLDSIALSGSVRFLGPVNLTAGQAIQVGSGGVIAADAGVDLTAPYVKVGTAFASPVSIADQQLNPYLFSSGSDPFYFLPTAGSGSLSVNATLIDIGTLSLQDIGAARLVAGSGGDIRGDGTLDLAGDLSLSAGQIYPVTETNFTISAYNYTDNSGGMASARTGSVTLTQDGSVPAVPLSGDGQLNIYASTITQDGVLRAPLGSIEVGYDGTGSTPVDLITGAGTGKTGAAIAAVPIAQNTTLGPGSITSVSAAGMIIPFGQDLNGSEYVDPIGQDISAAGVLVTKAIHVAGLNVADQSGSLVDLSGGGDLLANQFISGTGGTSDILGSTTSYAILPGTQIPAAPIDPLFDAGYTSASLPVGAQVYLNGGPNLAAGYYTLLPARYAVLPGAFLVTKQAATTVPPGSGATTADGALLVGGFLTNGLNGARTGPALESTFEVASSTVVQARADYAAFTAGGYLQTVASSQSAAVPRLPSDAGQLVLAADASLSIEGALKAEVSAGEQGAQIDIASGGGANVAIIGSDVAASSLPAGDLVLDAGTLSQFGDASLLVGGYRTQVNGLSMVNVTTANLTLDNAGSPLTGADITLVATGNVTLMPGSSLAPSGADVSGSAGALQVQGNGALVRISGDPTATVIRAGQNFSTSPSLVIGDQVQLGAAAPVGSVILDSSDLVSFSPTATISALSATLDSGAISFNLGDLPASALQPSPGLVISSAALANLQASAQNLSLLSYSTIDTYGSGTIGTSGAHLSLHTGSIRGFDLGSGQVTLEGSDLLLNDSAGGMGSAAASASSGTLAISAATVTIGSSPFVFSGTWSDAGYTISNAAQATSLRVGEVISGTGIQPGTTIQAINGTTLTLSAETTSAGSNASVPGAVQISGFNQVQINALQSVIGQGVGGLAVTGNLQVATPILIGAANSIQSIDATGVLGLTSIGNGNSSLTGGLGARLTLSGQDLSAATMISLPSGTLQLTSTAGDLSVGGRLDVSGTAVAFNNVVENTDAGQIVLTSQQGSVDLFAGSVLDLSAAAGGAGNAGALSISAPNGTLALATGASLQAQGGTGGNGGSFMLDVQTYEAGGGSSSQLDSLEASLDPSISPGGPVVGGFTHSQQIRIRSGDVELNSTAAADEFDLSADSGSVIVDAGGKIIGTQESNGDIDTSVASTGWKQLLNPGQTGGTIELEAGGSLVLDSGSLLTVEGQQMDNAGRGGSLTLEAGDETDASTGAWQNQAYTGNASITIASGATLDLSVLSGPAANRPDELSGTLTLRAPQILDGAGNPVVAINPVLGTIIGAAQVTAEGYALYDLTGTGQSIDSVEGAVQANGNLFATNEGDPAVAGTPAAVLFGSAQFKQTTPLVVVMPGAEIVNRIGDLTLNTSWDLSSFRFGPDQVAGDLTLRAAGNLVLAANASLSDGFTPVAPYGLWDGVLLPAGSPSWSYRLVAGADFNAADFRDVAQPVGTGLATGSLLLGEGSTALPTSPSNARSSIIPKFFQTIRTGTGNISIFVGNDVQLLNPLATIYTAGTQSAALAGYTPPNINYSAGTLGAKQTPLYPVLFSQDGGNVVISAGNNIEHLVVNSSGQLVPDSTRELPTNWLYRAGNGSSTATAWWTDFSNFFEGVGALGGGNVTLTAGNSIDNVDAVIPTNARETTVAGTPTLTELGGGDLTVTTGGDLNGGVYYVERGNATLNVGGSVTTNPTRAALSEDEVETDQSSGIVPDSATWLPTTFFLGQGSINVAAEGDVQLGGIFNPFLLPGGINNNYQNKSYFLTYGSSDAVKVSSLNGTVTLKDSPDGNGGAGSLSSWYQNVLASVRSPTTFASISQPWLRLDETSVTSILTAAAILPPTLEVTSFSGDIDMVGGLELAPSATGTVDLLAGGSVNGVEVNGVGAGGDLYASAVINLSDASPARLPSVYAPLFSATSTTTAGVLNPVSSLFAESGSTQGASTVIQTEETLHAPGLLHAGDVTPVQLTAKSGSISGLTLFSSKLADVVAGEDITDVGLYIQNDNANDVSVVAAGRNIIAYDPTSPLREAAQANGNQLSGGSSGPSMPGSGTPTSGDIQVSGPGTIEVTAGQNLSLGVGTINPDGTGAGLTSIGNQRNPFLPQPPDSAQIIVAAGTGAPSALDAGSLDFTDSSGKGFVDQFLNPASAPSSVYLPDLGALLNLSGATNAQVWAAYENLPLANRNALALTIFYDVLRDSGRSHSSGIGLGYALGDQAIQALFPHSGSGGDISLTSREIKTEEGGDIDILNPTGQVTVGFDLSSGQPVDQGILTVDGGNISIFSHGSVNVGTSRIFTLHGGNEIIYSTTGDIAAGASSKTVQSAPPTRVVVDPQSGEVRTDLAGLATGGGIGVLQTVAGTAAGNVDLIAPVGTVDAGDAGIRASGNVNIAAARVLNAGQISSGGSTTGVASVAAPNIAGLSAASSASAAATNSGDAATRQAAANATQSQTVEVPSIISVEVLGYGGGDAALTWAPHVMTVAQK